MVDPLNKFITYSPNKGSSFGHSANNRSVIELYDRVEAFRNYFGSPYSITTMLTNNGFFGSEEDNNSFRDDMKSILSGHEKDEYGNQINGQSFHLQWSNFRLPYNSFKLLSEIMAKAKAKSGYITYSEDMLFKLKNISGGTLEEYSNYQIHLNSHINVTFGTHQFIQPRIQFPFPAMCEEIQRQINLIESFKIFKMAKTHFRIANITKNGSVFYRKMI